MFSNSKSTMNADTASLSSTSTRSSLTSLKSLLNKRSEKAPKPSKPKPTDEMLQNEKAIREEARTHYFAMR